MELGLHECIECPRHAVSLPGSAECKCDMKYRGKNCLITRRPPPSDNDRFFRLKMTILIDSATFRSGSNIQQYLHSNISDFFSLNETFGDTLSQPFHLRGAGEGVYLERQEEEMRFPNTRRESSDSIILDGQVLILGNRSLFASDIQSLERDLNHYFPYCRISNVSVDCGQGSERRSAGMCRTCLPGFYKDSFDSSPCLECPRHSSTEGYASTNRTACICMPGYYPVGPGVPNSEISSKSANLTGQGMTCSRPGMVSEERAKQMASTFSTITAVAISTSIATAAGSAVSYTRSVEFIGFEFCGP